MRAFHWRKVIGLLNFLLVISVVDFAVASPDFAADKQAFVDFAMQRPGDAVRGKQIFADEAKTACVRCHTTDQRGGKVGPDLASIGDKYSRRELIRCILEPSAIIAIGYGTTIVETTSGESYEGVVQQATDSWIELMGGDGKSVRIATRDIKTQRTSKISLMPENLESALSLNEFSDLVAYLASLHQVTDNSGQTSAMPAIIPIAQKAVEIEPYFDSKIHFTHPTAFGEVPGFTNLFVVTETAGKSWIVERTAIGDVQTVLIDLSGNVRAGGGCGLLGFAFHPEFRRNRKYYLEYQVEKDGKISTLIVERKFAKDFKSDSRENSRLIIEVPSATQDHNGGGIAFGPDGFLYLGMGDTGPQNDPQGHAQNMDLLIGKILRIDVDHTQRGLAYKIPKNNPFLKRADVRPEIWASGFREPWRFSFDSATGDFWIGDVGQSLFEEITVARAGENHGWNIYEGVTPFSERNRRVGENYISPVFAYSHQQGVSVTGGFVYRGQRAPAMSGRYICGDFGSHRIWALTQTNRTLTSVVEIGRAPAQIVSFAQDSQGELYLVGYDTGLIYQMNLAVVNLQSAQPTRANLSE